MSGLLFRRSTLAIVLPLHATERSRSAVLHLHEALCGKKEEFAQVSCTLKSISILNTLNDGKPEPECSTPHLIAVGFAVVAADGVVLRGADASASAELEVEVLHASRKRRNIDVAPENIN